MSGVSRPCKGDRVFATTIEALRHWHPVCSVQAARATLVPVIAWVGIALDTITTLQKQAVLQERSGRSGTRTVCAAWRALGEHRLPFLASVLSQLISTTP